ncbi:hypothetical protein [Nitrosomonas sp.]|uniref:hypothetical protein n=1 Tax=Nitrosomonas sp. TaxID=42353 RepID=UPI00260B6898|nr:hypothetical protein [Nitrosomonas sp.]
MRLNPAGDGEFKAEYRVVKFGQWYYTLDILQGGGCIFDNGQPDRLVGVTRDVTEQKNLQKKLQAQRDETENIFKQQVAALTASAIAHELNQPLTAISAYGESGVARIRQRCFKL